jgi:hypothetical protein
MTPGTGDKHGSTCLAGELASGVNELRALLAQADRRIDLLIAARHQQLADVQSRQGESSSR